MIVIIFKFRTMTDYITRPLFEMIQKSPNKKLCPGLYRYLICELKVSRSTVAVHIKKLCAEGYILLNNENVIRILKVYPKTTYENRVPPTCACTLFFFLSDFQAKYDRMPSISEISEGLSLKTKSIRDYFFYLKSGGYIFYTRIDGQNLRLTGKTLLSIPVPFEPPFRSSVPPFSLFSPLAFMLNLDWKFT